MNRKPTSRLLPCLLALALLLQGLMPVGQVLAAPTSAPTAQRAPLTIDPNEGWVSPIGGISSVPGELDLASSSLTGTPLTRQDYQDAYNRARLLLEIGHHFRSRELQRLDPEKCVATPDDEDKCSFSVTGIQNNYVDFSDGRLYWRFCADYDEEYVGRGDVEQSIDDPSDLLNINASGYCPTWNRLTNDQKSRRVLGQNLNPGNEPDFQQDIRNALVDAIRIYAVLAVAEPADVTIDVQAAGGEIESKRVRDLGIAGMLQTTREIANVHMVFGNEFMVDALRFPFSVEDTSSQVIVEDEQRQLLRALRQYGLASEVLIFTLNYNLNGATPIYVSDFFTDQEFQLFAAATRQTVVALTEIAKRDRLLGSSSLEGDQAAIRRLNQSFLDQYLLGIALASQATGLVEDDPATDDVDESKSHFIENGGRDIMNNLRRIVQQAQNIRAELNPFGYEDSFVPLKPFEDLLELTCGGRTACAGNSGLFASAQTSGVALKDSQRTFDEKYEQLKVELTDLGVDFDNTLQEICGPSTDKDGDGLKDFDVCGVRDTDGDGYYDKILGPDSGLMALNFWEMIAAYDNVSLVKRQMENKAEEIGIEEERSGNVVFVTLGTAQAIGAHQLAIGKLNAVREIDSHVVSGSATAYADASLSLEISNKASVKGSVNPIGCVTGACTAENEFSTTQTFSAQAGVRLEASIIGTMETVYDPNEEAIAQYENKITLKEAEQNAEIEGANSTALIRQLMLEQTELMIEYDLAVAALNRVLSEHNLLVDKYLLTLTQRQETIAALQDSYLSKPYFRLFRDTAALEAARTLDQASQAAYLTAKAFEYETLSPVNFLNELFRVRNPANLRAFLDKLASDYQALPTEQFSKRTYRLSLAEDIWGLTDENLDPSGTLTPAEIDQLRKDLFQQRLFNNRYTNAETGFDRVVVYYGTPLDHPKFLRGVFNNRIAGVGDTQPGCASGCRGVWLNLITDQNVDGFRGDLPQIKLSHSGHASYRNGSLDTVSVDPGPAVMVGRSLPPGFGGETRSAIMTTHVNLDDTANPDPNKQENRFTNLSIATTQWSIEIDLTNPTENTILDLSMLQDIEVRMDTTYVTPSRFQQVAAASSRLLDAEMAGLEPDAEDQAVVVAFDREMDIRTLQAASAVAAAPLLGLERQRSAIEGADIFGGLAVVTSPVNLGVVDVGFDLKIGGDGNVTGTLCDGCSSWLDFPTAVAGTYNAANKELRIQTTEVLTRTLAGRVAERTLKFEGVLSDEGEIEGTFEETVTGIAARPIVSKGEIILSRLSGSNAQPPPQNQAPLASADTFTVLPDSTNNLLDVLKNDTDPEAGALVVASVGGAAHGVAMTDGTNLTYSPQTGFIGIDRFAYTVSDGEHLAVATVTVTVAHGLGPNDDADADGILNKDEDANGDGDFTDDDTDNDGMPDYLDGDDDGDGIPTATEGTVDTDGDGTPDYLDTDDDGDGIPTATEGTGDSDGDGIPDYLDDDDNTNSSGDSMIFLPLVSR